MILVLAVVGRLTASIVILHGAPSSRAVWNPTKGTFIIGISKRQMKTPWAQTLRRNLSYGTTENDLPDSFAWAGMTAEQLRLKWSIGHGSNV